MLNSGPVWAVESDSLGYVNFQFFVCSAKAALLPPPSQPSARFISPANEAAPPTIISFELTSSSSAGSGLLELCFYSIFNYFTGDIPPTPLQGPINQNSPALSTILRVDVSGLLPSTRYSIVYYCRSSSGISQPAIASGVSTLGIPPAPSLSLPTVPSLSTNFIDLILVTSASPGYSLTGQVDILSSCRVDAAPVSAGAVAAFAQLTTNSPAASLRFNLSVTKSGSYSLSAVCTNSAGRISSSD